jgi:hypothetical protein
VRALRQPDRPAVFTIDDYTETKASEVLGAQMVESIRDKLSITAAAARLLGAYRLTEEGVVMAKAGYTVQTGAAVALTAATAQHPGVIAPAQFGAI